MALVELLNPNERDIAVAISEWGQMTGRIVGGSYIDFGLSRLAAFMDGSFPGDPIERGRILNLIRPSGTPEGAEGPSGASADGTSGGDGVSSPYDYGQNGQTNESGAVADPSGDVHFLGAQGEYAGGYLTLDQVQESSALAALLPIILGAAAVARVAGATVLRFATNWRVLAGAEGIDLSTPGIDLPSPSDVPGAMLEIARTIFIDVPGQFIGFGGGGGGGFPGGVLASMHGPAVKEWTTPGGYRHWLFQDGWTAHERKNGTIRWYKPKKPIVYVPGGPLSRRAAYRLAKLYKQTRDDAKKTFNLVDRKAAGAGKPQIDIVETGPGDVVVKTNGRRR